MKVNSAMRRLVRIRVMIGWAAALAVVGLTCFVGVTVATEIGQTTVHQTDGPPVPNVDFGALMSTAL